MPPKAPAVPVKKTANKSKSPAAKSKSPPKTPAKTIDKKAGLDEETKKQADAYNTPKAKPKSVEESKEIPKGKFSDD